MTVVEQIQIIEAVGKVIANTVCWLMASLVFYKVFLAKDS